MISPSEFDGGTNVNKVITQRFVDGWQVPTDIRSFLAPADCIVQQLLVEQILKTPLDRIPVDLDHDTILRECMRWVSMHIKYVPDAGDFWQLPVETIAIREGDCEDGANLLASLLLASGFPPYYLRVCVGQVWAHGIPGSDPFGHVWVTYHIARPGQQTLVTPYDWCWRPDVESLASRRALWQRPEYSKIWYSYNNEKCMAHNERSV